MSKLHVKVACSAEHIHTIFGMCCRMNPFFGFRASECVSAVLAPLLLIKSPLGDSTSVSQGHRTLASREFFLSSILSGHYK